MQFKTFRLPIALVIIGFAFVAISAAENQFGVVRISKLPEKRCTEPAGNLNFFNPFDTVYFYIEGRSDFSARNHCGQIDSLDLSKKHTVVLKVHNKARASFFFSFKNSGVDTLCFWYYPCYGSWTIESDLKKCACGKKNPK